MIARSLAQRTLRLATNNTVRRIASQPNRTARLPQPKVLQTRHLHQQTRSYATTDPQSAASSPQNTPAGDSAVEEITELYATAYDEFEIASESTEANATYAEEDRKAAREELDRVLDAYRKVGDADAGTAEEVRRRVGQRIRELQQGVEAMEERAMEQD